MFTGPLYEVPGRKQWVIVQDGHLLRTWCRAIGSRWQGGEVLQTSKLMAAVEQEKVNKGYQLVGQVQVDPVEGPQLDAATDNGQVPSPTQSVNAYCYLTGAWSIDQLALYFASKGLDTLRAERSLIFEGVEFRSPDLNIQHSLSATVHKEGTSPEALVAVLALCKEDGFKASTDQDLVDLQDLKAFRTLLDSWIAEGLTPEVITLAEDYGLLPKQVRWSEIIQPTDQGSIFF